MLLAVRLVYDLQTKDQGYVLTGRLKGRRLEEETRTLQYGRSWPFLLTPVAMEAALVSSAHIRAIVCNASRAISLERFDEVLVSLLIHDLS